MNHYLPALTLLLLWSVPTPTEATLIRLNLAGEVINTYGSRLPDAVVAKAPVSLSFAFEKNVLQSNGKLPQYPQARTERIDILDGSLRIADEELRFNTGGLLVSDNKSGGFCTSECKSWTDDVIDLLFYGEAPAFGDQVRFTTAGGFISRAPFPGPLSDVLTVGTDIGDAATWNNFPDGVLYLSLRRDEGGFVGNVTIKLQQVRAVPEPSAALLMLLAAAIPTINRMRHIRRTA